MQQAVQQRLEAGFARDLRPGAAFGLIGRVQVLQPRLGVSGSDGCLQFRAQLALFGDALQHRGAPLLQLAQIDQALLEVAQLGVVQPVGGLLAVARDERHGGALVEQLDCRFDLPGVDAQLLCNALGNRHRTETTCVVIGILKVTHDTGNALPE